MPEENLVSWVILIAIVAYLHCVAIRAAFNEREEREYEYVMEERREMK